MAEKKMTRVSALEIAMAAVSDPEALEVLTHMRDQLAKPKAKTDTKSKARMENEATVRALYAMCGDTAFDSKYVMAKTSAMTPQKVVGIMRVGIELGLFEKFKDGKTTVYKAVR